jgi:methanogenic corrinoid protein MtbC1
MDAQVSPGRLASAALLAQCHAIASSVVALEFTLHPQLAARYGAQARERTLQDALYHLSVLAQSLALDKPAFFSSYIAWARIVLAHRGVPVDILAEHMRCMARVLAEQLPPEAAEPAVAMIEAVIAELAQMPEDAAPCMDDTQAHAALARGYLDALLRGERHQAMTQVRDALAAGVPLQEIYLDVFAPTQREIGRLWQMNEITVAQEHYCSAATQLIMSQASAPIFEGPRSERKLVATCVAGDLHEIGPRMVADFFEMAGWRTYYLGANVPTEAIIQTLADTHADVLAISASIAFHVSAVKQLIDRVRADARCGAVRIIVGGHPFNADASLWREVGADGHAIDAKAAVALAERVPVLAS